MRAIVDIGNTAIKLGLFEGQELVDFSKDSDLDAFESRLKNTDFSGALICSVKSENFTNHVKSIMPDALLMGPDLPLPIVNGYESKHTLGYDRLANAVGAAAQFPDEHVVIVDSGTCLKIDFIHANRGFLGGSISPGLQMRFRSLNTFTDNLPLVEEAPCNSNWGGNTNDSILVGVVQGMRAEIEGRIGKLNSEFPDLKVVLTGGDLETFKSLDIPQKSSIFADNFLTLKGLNEILIHNEKR